MTADPNRSNGYYWIRFEGVGVPAEYVDFKTSTRGECRAEDCDAGAQHWHIPGVRRAVGDADICHVMSQRMRAPERGAVLLQSPDKPARRRSKTR